VYSFSDPPADDYGSDAFVMITIDDASEAAKLGFERVASDRAGSPPA
jgi:hypothetical protein